MVPGVKYCCVRPEHVVSWRIVERLRKFELEKPLSFSKVDALFCRSSEEKGFDRNVDNGGLACNVLEGSLRVT